MRQVPLALLALAALAASPAGAACLCLKCLTGAYSSFQQSAGSMKPAIEPGDCVTVDRGAAVDRGSILAFAHPVTPGVTYVKRLIGLPGDTVELRAGVVVLNGVALPQTPAEGYPQAMLPEGPQGAWPHCVPPVANGETCLISRATETLPGGIAYSVLDMEPEAPFDSTAPVTIPPGLVFVLGDNRDNSADSRMPQGMGGMGLVPVANILGPVVDVAPP